VRIGLIYEPGLANGYYRAVIPMRALELRGHDLVWPSDPVNVPLRELASCDVVHCYRRMDRLDDLRKLAQRGVAISFDNDDNFAAAEVSYGGVGLQGRRHNQAVFRLILKAAALADVATTTNPLLADQYRSAGINHVIVIDNYLDRHAFGFGSSGKHDGVVVGWVAGREHRVEVERLRIVDCLRRLLDAHPQLRVRSVGLRLPLPADRYEHVEEIAFPDLLKEVGGYDVGIAPLVDTPFNRCRSAVKLKEYGAGRTAWAASPVGPYRELGAKQGGTLIEDDDWFSALDDLIRHPRERNRLAKRALKWAKSQTMDRHVEQWEHALGDAIQRAQARTDGQDTAAAVTAAR
jgi:hypothetical protein